MVETRRECLFVKGLMRLRLLKPCCVLVTLCIVSTQDRVCYYWTPVRTRYTLVERCSVTGSPGTAASVSAGKR